MTKKDTPQMAPNEKVTVHGKVEFAPYKQWSSIVFDGELITRGSMYDHFPPVWTEATYEIIVVRKDCMSNSNLANTIVWTQK